MFEQLQLAIVDRLSKVLLWPVYDHSAPIGQWFGDNATVYKRFGQEGHNGVDILVPDFTPVLAPCNGIVRYAGNGAGEPLLGNAAGIAILIRHESGMQVGLAHLSKVFVEEGYMCKAGEVIALSGHTGATTGAHLHIETLGTPLDVRNGYMGRVDPLPYMAHPIGGA